LGRSAGVVCRVRTGVYAERWFDTSKNEWACKPVHAPLTPELLVKHLSPEGPHLGVYVVSSSSDAAHPEVLDQVRLATLDLDNKKGVVVSEQELRNVALRLAETARKFKLIPWAISSGSGAGYHLHFFWDKPQSAGAVRELLATVLAAEGFRNGTGSVGQHEAEVFPKQPCIDAGAGKVGNLIALPFGRKSRPLDNDLQPSSVALLWHTSTPVPIRKQCEALPKDKISPGDIDLEALRGALDYLAARAHDYDCWIRYGLAIKTSLGDAGFDIWHAWSIAAENYKDIEDLHKKWATFLPGTDEDAITVATIFYEARQAAWDGGSAANHKLPRIRIVAGELPRMVNEAEAALLAAGVRFYKQDARVVRVFWDRGVTARNGLTSVLRLVTVEAANLLERLETIAHWVKYDAHRKTIVRKDCPRAVAERYLARKGEWALPPLLGVITAPTLRADGSILDQPGYDKKTGLVYQPMGVTFPPVPDQPTREDALRAIEQLKHPFREFPFVEGANLSVALADIITSVIRRSLPVAPMFAYSAPAAGTGKSLIVDIVCIIVTGERAAVITASKNEEEMAKRIDAAVLAGDAVIAIDNYDSPIKGSAICTALSQPTLKPRVLGKSELVQVPNTFSFHGTGNNLTVEGDATRRVLVSLLDAQVERPELRRFSFNVIEEVREERAALAIAALTVVRAYLISGAEQQATPLGGYEEWSRMVCDALIWLGEPNPVDVMERIRAADPHLADLKALIAAWQRVLGARQVLVRDVIAKAQETLPQHEQDPDNLASHLKNPDLHDALAAVAGDGRGNINPKKLGWWLRANRDKVVGLGGISYRLTQVGCEHNTATWQLVRAEEAAPQGKLQV
jgi:hypothetical protein